jgi:V8-like Glu-specific endopeptidase
VHTCVTLTVTPWDLHCTPPPLRSALAGGDDIDPASDVRAVRYAYDSGMVYVSSDPVDPGSRRRLRRRQLLTNSRLAVGGGGGQLTSRRGLRQATADDRRLVTGTDKTPWRTHGVLLYDSNPSELVVDSDTCTAVLIDLNTVLTSAHVRDKKEQGADRTTIPD